MRSDKFKWSMMALFGLLVACRAQRAEITSSELKSPTRVDLKAFDISILFPVHRVSGPIAKLPYISEKSVPDKARKLAEGGQLEDSGRFRVIAMRFDPCANKLQVGQSGGSCVPQIRLTWQEILETNGKFAGTRDTALHTAYGLKAQEAEELILILTQLRERAGAQDEGVALEEHPTILREGPDGAYMQGILGLIEKFATADRLTNLAFMRRELDRFPIWEMGHFSKTPDGFVEEGIPTLRSNSLKQRFRASQPVLEVIPLGTILPLTVPFVPPGTPSSANDEDRAMVPFRNSLKIENPLFHNPLSLDCGSCHRTSALFAARNQAIGLGKLKQRPEEFSSTIATLIPHVSSDPASLHMFSYFETKPEVTARVVDETLDLLAYLKKLD